MVPLRHKLHTGDIVEILTQPGHKPSRDWLAIVKSSRARNKIKHWLNVHQRERAIEIGRKLIEKEARKYRISLKDIKDDDLQKIASDYGLGRPDDLMAGIGYGKYSARQVLAKFAPAGAQPMSEDGRRDGRQASPAWCGASLAATEQQRHPSSRATATCWSIAPAVAIPFAARPSSATSLAAKASPSTAINCPNVTNLLYEPERRIDVEWAQTTTARPVAYPVKLTVFCDDRFGMLKQITAVISDTQTNIRNIEARTSNGQANVDVVLDIADLKHLENIIDGVRKIPGVHDVQRLQKI